MGWKQGCDSEVRSSSQGIFADHKQTYQVVDLNPFGKVAKACMCCECSSTEQRFLEASLAFQAGKPIVSDEEYDTLKDQLRKKNSKVVQQVPLLPISPICSSWKNTSGLLFNSCPR